MERRLSPKPPTSGLNKGTGGGTGVVALLSHAVAVRGSSTGSTVISLFGEVRLRCSYYHCRNCHIGLQRSALLRRDSCVRRPRWGCLEQLQTASPWRQSGTQLRLLATGLEAPLSA